MSEKTRRHGIATPTWRCTRTNQRNVYYVFPKPLVPYENTTAIESIISRFKNYGVKKFYISVYYKKNLIKSYLDDNQYKNLSFLEEKPLSIDLPNNIECEIESTEGVVKGQTAASSYKPAILDNGLKLQKFLIFTS